MLFRSVVVVHRLSCSAACGILPNQGSNPCPLHWQADSQPLHHEGSLSVCSFDQLAIGKKKQNYSLLPLEPRVALVSNTSNVLCTLSYQDSVKHKQAFSWSTRST